jgi:hypothetical protein
MFHGAPQLVMSKLRKAFVVVLSVAVQWSPSVAHPAPRGNAMPPMHKFVTEKASFVLYLPAGWHAEEQNSVNSQTLVISDGSGRSKAVLAIGAAPEADVLTLARMEARQIGKHHPDLVLNSVNLSKDRSRLVFDGTFTDERRMRVELRGWLTLRDGRYIYTAIFAPQGQLESIKPTLLSVLANTRLTKLPGIGSIQATLPPLRPYRLSDGSATFRLPEGWQVRERGKGQFIASDRAGTPSFMVASADVLTPALQVRVPGMPVSPYLSPDRAWRFLTDVSGLARNMHFVEVTARPDIAHQLAQVYTAGPVEVADMLYTCETREGLSKGYTLGISFGSRLGATWSFRHITMVAPLEQFERYAPLFGEMLKSYALDETWARNYVTQGMARLRQMQRETSQLVSRNSQEIRQMMQAAYDERQKSQDYLDYKRSQTIRGEQDWISTMEGGTVYHSDSWGTRNTVTGETWEGQPYDYVNFQGRNPKYNENMTPIDSRELWEQYGR